MSVMVLDTGWAIMLEIEVEEGYNSDLKLKAIGPNQRPYLKHFLETM